MLWIVGLKLAALWPCFETIRHKTKKRSMVWLRPVSPDILTSAVLAYEFRHLGRVVVLRTTVENAGYDRSISLGAASEAMA